MNLEPPTLNAFSLIEVVIALAILSIGMVGAMRVFPVGLRASSRAEVDSRAAIVGQRVIESLKLKSWEELAEGETASQEDGFTVTTRISRLNVEHLIDPTRLKAVEITVQPAGAGRARALTFITYVRRPPS